MLCRKDFKSLNNHLSTLLPEAMFERCLSNIALESSDFIALLILNDFRNGIEVSLHRISCSRNEKHILIRREIDPSKVRHLI